MCSWGFPGGPGVRTVSPRHSITGSIAAAQETKIPRATWYSKLKREKKGNVPAVRKAHTVRNESSGGEMRVGASKELTVRLSGPRGWAASVTRGAPPHQRGKLTASDL